MSDTFSWQNFINQETKKPYFKEIKASLIKSNRAGHNIFPPPKDFFKAFEKCDYETTKIVIIGQDPYPTIGVANGLAFSVNNGQQIVKVMVPKKIPHTEKNPAHYEENM